MMLSKYVYISTHTNVFIRAHFAINIHNEMHCFYYNNRNFYYYSKKKRKYLYQKKRFEANNKLMLGGEEERVKSNEAAISRFSSQVPNVVYHLTENVKFNQGDES